MLNTKIIRADDNDLNEAGLCEAGEIIKKGGLVAFPTETVYGLGGDALNPESSRKIYAAKGRPSDNPLIVHICRMEDLEKIVSEVPESAKKLAAKFWPGPLTMIFKKNSLVPYETTGGLDTVAVRFPVNKVACKFIEAAGGFVAAPSANISGRPSPTRAKYVEEDMNGRIEMIIDGGDVGIGLESTIIDLTEGVPTILRPGYITEKKLSDVLGKVDTDKTILGGDAAGKPKAPGMKYRHYAPKGKLTIVEGEKQAVIDKINELTAAAGKEGRKTGVIGTSQNLSLYKADCIKNAGDEGNEEEIAHNLYTILREFDDENVEVMFSEAFAYTGMGQAIMNRLLKAAGHEVIHI